VPERAGLRVIGAGVGRTGTTSLKAALERLLGAPCYHMLEVFQHRDHVPHWHAAARGRMPEWRELLAGYAAAVDWPASAFWPELCEAFPDALVVLSLRDPQAWWESADETIFPTIREPAREPGWYAEWQAMVHAMLGSRFGAIDDAASAMAAFERHNARVRELAPPERLLEWRAADGWEPLCAALDLPVPDEPFPRVNTRDEWRAPSARS